MANSDATLTQEKKRIILKDSSFILQIKRPTTPCAGEYKNPLNTGG
jgi:hypothetical protein